MVKFHALSNVEIDHYFTGRPEWGGCYPKDQLPSKMQDKYYIINLDDAKNGGTHWVMTCISNNKVLYFDPFGVTCPIEALQFMKTTKKRIYYSMLTLQDLDSVVCGYYCIYVIDQMTQKGRTFLNIVSEDFNNNRLANDRKIKRYFNKVEF